MDHYQLFEVAPSADLRTITRAWKKQLRRWHPDRNPSADALALTQRLNAAYDVLKDPGKRARYDQTLPLARTIKRRTPASASTQQSDQAAANDPNFANLAWNDDAFVLGHWYATGDGRVFEVLGIDATTIRVRYTSGTSGSLAIAKRWQEWEDFVYRHQPDSKVAQARHAAADRARQESEERARHEEAARVEAERRREAEAAERAAREAAQRAQQEALERERWAAAEYARREAEERSLREAREHAEREEVERRAREMAELARRAAVEAEAHLLAVSDGALAAARFLEDAGWVSVQDNRAHGGIVTIFAAPDAQERVDRLMEEFQALGVPFKSAPRTTPDGTVTAWWIQRRYGEA